MTQTSDQKLDKILSKIDSMQGDIGVLKADVGVLKSDVNILKSDVGTLKSDVRVLKQDSAVMKSDISTLKHVQGQQSIQLHHIRTDVKHMKNSFRGQTAELSRLATLFEDFEDRFQAAGELDT